MLFNAFKHRDLSRSLKQCYFKDFFVLLLSFSYCYYLSVGSVALEPTVVVVCHSTKILHLLIT